jgi:hypothetical protein
LVKKIKIPMGVVGGLVVVVAIVANALMNDHQKYVY